MKDIYAVLDIGSASLKLLVGEVVSANINVLYSETRVSQGVKKGKIVDEALVANEIDRLVKKASVAIGTTIKSIALTIPSLYAHIYQSEGVTQVESRYQNVENSDILRALKLSKRFELEQDEEIISVIPTAYLLDSKRVLELPVNQKADSLTVESLVITTKKKLLYSYIRVIESIGLEVIDVQINVYACAKEAFDEVYIQEGAILIDIGYKQSTISFFEGGYLRYIAQAPVGGYHLTKHIATKWGIPMEKAEVYKVKYGTCDRYVSDEDIIHITQEPDGDVIYTQKDLTNELIEAVEEMMEIIKTKIDVINDGRGYETVIVGGGGELPDIAKVASHILESSVRTYRPDTLGARHMIYVSCLGMMYYLNERARLNNDVHSSITLPDISHTMSIRFKGLTKNRTVNENKKKGKLSYALESFFNEED